MTELSNKLESNLDRNSRNKSKQKLNDNVIYKFLPTLGNARCHCGQSVTIDHKDEREACQ